LYRYQIKVLMAIYLKIIIYFLDNAKSVTIKSRIS